MSESGPPESANVKKTPKVAMCIREKANWSKVVDEHKFDNKNFDPVRVKADIAIASPKMATLIQNIKALDEHDMQTKGHTFKHFIYSDVRTPYGAKMIASGLAAFGFKHAYKLGSTGRGMGFVMDAPEANAFATLTTVPFFQRPVGINFRKEVLKRFNARPSNINGEELRVIILDSGLREGVDLFDVKYVHLFEPVLTPNDEKQAIGRATRFCGQKGLEFNNGWPLHVYRYDTGDLFQLFLDYSNVDTAKLAFAKVLDGAVINAAVDRSLTRAFDVGITDIARSPSPSPRSPRSGGGYVNEYDRRAQENAMRIAEARKKASEMARVPFKAIRDEIARKAAIKEAEMLVIWKRKEQARLDAEEDAARVRAAEAVIIQERQERMRAEEDARRAEVERKLRIEQELLADIARQAFIKRNAALEAERQRQAQANQDAMRRYEEERQAAYRAARAAAEEARLQAIRDREEAAAEVERQANAAIKAAFDAKFNRPRAPGPPVNGTVAQLDQYVRKWYADDCTWPPLENVNGCLGGPGATGNNETLVEFSPTQNFIRHYLSPESPYKGMLAYHSVGTGKTCLAIAVATTYFEPAAWTILYVTKTTLKGDVWKNMFDQSCSLVLQSKMLEGLKIPVGARQADKMRLLSKSWSVIQPLSYRQFSNMLRGKGALALKLKGLNGATDPLKRTLVVVDEAHKLFVSDMPPSEKADINAIRAALANSEAKSGADAVKLLLMTGTPYTDDPMDMIKILNLLLKDDEKMPEEFAAFAGAYLADDGEFTASGLREFSNKIAGRVSYLNREKDRRTFSYPIIKDVVVPMSLFEHTALAKDLQNNAAELAIAEVLAEELKAPSAEEVKVEANVAAVIKESEEALRKCLDSKAALRDCKAAVKARGAIMLAEAKERKENLAGVRQYITDELYLCDGALAKDCSGMKADIARMKVVVNERVRAAKASRSALAAKEEAKIKELKNTGKALKVALTAAKAHDRSQQGAVDECIKVGVSAVRKG